MNKVLILAFLLVTTPAMAQKERNTPVGKPIVVAAVIPVENLSAETKRQLSIPTTIEVLQVINTDATVSLADANANKDAIAASCYQAIVTVTQAKIDSGNVTGGGIILVFQKIRDITRLNASPLGLTLIQGCAALAQDSSLNMLDLFTKLGAAALLKGVLI